MARWPRFGLLTVFTLALGLVAAACGGGEEATPTRAAPTATTAPAATATSAPQATATRPPAQPTATTAPAATPRPQPTATTAAPSAPAGRLTVAMGSFDNEIFVPWIGGRFAGMHTYGVPMYDWLFWGNQKDSGTAPGIITKWEIAPDALSWTLTVRNDLVFHTGAKLSAEDVKYHFDQFMRPDTASTNAGSLRGLIKSATVLSPTTVRVEAKAPWPLLPHDLSLRGGPEGPVVSSAHIQQIGEKAYNDKPVGTGPWKFLERQPGIRIRFEASGIKHPYRESAKFKELEYLLIPTEATRVAMLKTRAADIVDIGLFDTAKSLSKDFQLVLIDDVNVGIMFFGNVTDARIKGKPTEKKDVRIALELAVNKQEIADTIFGGFAAVAARTMVQPGTLGYDPTWKPRPYDPEQAKRLLAQNGYPTGFDINIYNNAAPGAEWMVPQSEAIAGYWSSIGVRPRLFLLERSVAAGMYRARPQDPNLIGNAQPIFSRVNPTNVFLLRSLYGSRGNTLVFPSPEMDALIDAAGSATDPKKQADLITQAQQLVWENVPDFGTVRVPSLFAAGPAVASWKAMPTVGIGVFMETVVPK